MTQHSGPSGRVKRGEIRCQFNFPVWMEEGKAELTPDFLMEEGKLN